MSAGKSKKMILLRPAMACSARVGRTNCCIVGCANTYSNTTEDVHFYSFPNSKYFPGRREKWIAAVKRVNVGGKPWLPKPASKICSVHFVGGRKVDHPNHPAFLPTIMPTEYKKKNQGTNSDMNRFVRATLYSQRRTSTSDSSSKLSINSDASVQTDFSEICSSNVISMFCFQENHNLATQCLIASPVIIDKAVQTNSVKLHVLNSVKDAICGPDKSECYFSGYTSVSSDMQLTGLAGVTLSVFALLLSFIPNPHGFKISRENRLLLFLCKLKLGLSFTSLGALFGVHRTTSSRIFFEVLELLTKSMGTLVFWPSKFSIKSTMPSVFSDYPTLRAIIDCTELRTQRPHRTDQQVLLYSDYKGTYTMKFLIGISPNGMITFISKAYGGRATDAFITSDSGFLNLVTAGDQIMADKGFPEIKSELEANRVSLVMPPFAKKGQQFTEAENKDTYKIASVRIHVERCIGRIKIFKILDKITTDLFENMDDVMLMCCILVNLQKPILKKDFGTCVKID